MTEVRDILREAGATVDGATQRGLCTLQTASLVSLAARASGKVKTPAPAGDLAVSYPFTIKCHALEGTTQKDNVRFVSVFEVHVHTGKEWINIPLLPSTMAIVSASVETRPMHGNCGDDDEDNDDDDEVVAADGVPNATPASTSDEAKKASARSFVALVNSSHTLVTRTRGVHTVRIESLLAYTSSKTRSAVSIPRLQRSSRLTVDFTVSQQQPMVVTVDPCLHSVSSIVGDAHAADASVDSTIRAHLPPTDTVSIRWVEKEIVIPPTVTAAASAAQSLLTTDDARSIASSKDITKSLPLSATVEHAHMLSIGDGMLTITSAFNYDIRNGDMATIEIDMDPRLRVLSVDGGPAMKRWDVVRALTDGDASAVKVDVLKVVLDHGIEGEYSVTITSELELGSRSCDFLCPVFAHSQEVFTREKGFLAIEARTNVEIDQLKNAIGCVPVDVEELPHRLRRQASHAIVLAYKYLLPDYKLTVSVKKHGDVDVLVAAVDHAYFQATLTEHGKTMYRLRMRVRNTSKQYVRIEVAPDCEIWSTMVNGTGVKPARDEETGAIMVALQKKSKLDSATFGVEIVWLATAAAPLGRSGTSTVSFPKVDLPLNKVSASIYLPDHYSFKDFTGDLASVDHFTSSVDDSTWDLNDDQHQQVYLQSNLAQQGLGYNDSPPSLRRQLSITKLMPQSAPNISSMGMNKKRKAGVVPVRVEMVVSQASQSFERLLVVQTPMQLTARYSRVDKSYFQKRRVGVLLC